MPSCLCCSPAQPHWSLVCSVCWSHLVDKLLMLLEFCFLVLLLPFGFFKKSFYIHPSVARHWSSGDRRCFMRLTRQQIQPRMYSRWKSWVKGHHWFTDSLIHSHGPLRNIWLDVTEACCKSCDFSLKARGKAAQTGGIYWRLKKSSSFFSQKMFIPQKLKKTTLHTYREVIHYVSYSCVCVCVGGDFFLFTQVIFSASQNFTAPHIALEVSRPNKRSAMFTMDQTKCSPSFDSYCFDVGRCCSLLDVQPMASVILHHRCRAPCSPTRIAPTAVASRALLWVCSDVWRWKASRWWFSNSWPQLSYVPRLLMMSRVAAAHPDFSITAACVSLWHLCSKQVIISKKYVDSFIKGTFFHVLNLHLLCFCFVFFPFSWARLPFWCIMIVSVFINTFCLHFIVYGHCWLFVKCVHENPVIDLCHTLLNEPDCKTSIHGN